MDQLKMINRVCELSLADERINAVMMYGSFTKNTGDRYSDIEFYVFLNEESGFDKREWIAEVRPLELLYTNEFGTDVVVFDNLVRGEFHFHPVSEIDVVRSWEGVLDFSVQDKMKLVDKDGLLAAALDTIELVTPVWDTPENVGWVADSMINNLLFVGNVIKRGELARAVHLFFYLEKYLALLIRLYVDASDQWLDPMKELEKDIPEDWYKRYAEYPN